MLKKHVQTAQYTFRHLVQIQYKSYVLTEQSLFAFQSRAILNNSMQSSFFPFHIDNAITVSSSFSICYYPVFIGDATIVAIAEYHSSARVVWNSIVHSERWPYMCSGSICAVLLLSFVFAIHNRFVFVARRKLNFVFSVKF